MTVTTITTGGPGTYTVPAGKKWISVELYGHNGEDVLGGGGTGVGGSGGALRVLVRVVPGEVLDYCVGRLGSLAATDLCRGGAPTANIGTRTGGRGGGGTYIARRAYNGTGSSSTDRLMANMIAVAGGGGGGRNPDAPVDWQSSGKGGSSNSFESIVARYVRDGSARQSANWIHQTFLAGLGASNAPGHSEDYATVDPGVAGGPDLLVGGRAAQHPVGVQPSLGASLSGGDSSGGGAGGGGGYRGGAAGTEVSEAGVAWGMAGGAGLTWWDPYVSSVYYNSVGKFNSGAARIVINDDPLALVGGVAPLDIEPVGTGWTGLPGDRGTANLVARIDIDGIPAYDTRFHFVPEEGNRAVIPTGSTVPAYTHNLWLKPTATAGWSGSPSGLVPKTSFEPTFGTVYPFKSPYWMGAATSNAWLAGHVTERFYTRAAKFVGTVTLVEAYFSIRPPAGVGEQIFSTDAFNFSFQTLHEPRVALLLPDAGAKVAIPASSSGSVASFSATITDYASSNAYVEDRDTIQSYQFDFYEADQTTLVNSFNFTPSPALSHLGAVAVSAYPSMTTAQWARVAFWTVRATDGRGTQSSEIAKRPISLLARPVVQIVSPVANSIIEGSRPSIAINVTTPNGSGIFTTRYQILTSAMLSVHDVTLSGLVPSYTPSTSVFAGVGSYIIRVTVTDLLGIASTSEIAVTSDYAAPDAVVYTVDSSRVDDDGYVEVSWGEMIPSEGFSRWNVYRRKMPSTAWELLDTIPNAGITVYRDFTTVAGSIYMYSVTQSTVDRGGEIEGVVGVRAIVKTMPDVLNLASAPSPGYNSGAIPNGTIGFTSRAASNGSFGSSVTVSVTDTPLVGPIPGYNGKYIVHQYANATPPVDTGGLFFSPYSKNYADDTSSNTAVDGTSNMPVDGGSYTASLYIFDFLSAPGSSGYLAIEVYNSSGAIIPAYGATSQPAATSAWVRHSASTPVLGPDAKFMSVTWVNRGDGVAPINGRMFFAALMVERNDAVPPVPTQYFDGSTSMNQLYSYKWEGAAWLTQSRRSQVMTLPEDRTFLIVNSHYWLVDPVDPNRNLRLPSVKQYDYTEEYERSTTNVIGRGRHVDFGDRLGRAGTIVMSLREATLRSAKREDVLAVVARKSTMILKTPFGESFPVAFGNPAWAQLAGVGNADMGDLTLPFEEVY